MHSTPHCIQQNIAIHENPLTNKDLCSIFCLITSDVTIDHVCVDLGFLCDYLKSIELQTKHKHCMKANSLKLVQESNLNKMPINILDNLLILLHDLGKT